MDTRFFKHSTALIALMWLTALNTFGYDFEAGGICYNILSKKNHTASVTYKDPRTDTQLTTSCYSGSVKVPSTVVHKGISYTVVEIGRKAFCFADKLTQVSIPNTVRSIRFMAFGMTGLTRLHIPASVVKIESGFIQQSKKMKSISVDSKNPCYRASANVLFSKDMSRLAYCTPAPRRSYTIPSSVRRLEDCSFAFCNISDLTIPATVNVFVGDPFIGLNFTRLTNKTLPTARHIPMYKGQICYGMSPGIYNRPAR